MTRASSLVRSAPLGPPQPDYANQVLEVETDLDPLVLLERLQAIERRFGRVRRARWGPRTLDLDLLLVGSLQHRSPELELPHPELARRRFVLVPLNELAPSLVHPVLGKPISELLAQTKDRSTVTRWTAG